MGVQVLLGPEPEKRRGRTRSSSYAVKCGLAGERAAPVMKPPSRWWTVAPLLLPLLLLLLLLLLLQPLSTLADRVDGVAVGPSLDWLGISDSGGKSTPPATAAAGAATPCTVDDLVPPYDTGEDIADRWDSDDLVWPPPFDCTCRTLKASYHCPSLDTHGYPKWVPRAVSRGACEAWSRAALEAEPFPPGFRVLFYGNSHLRQVMESIVCAHPQAIESRTVTLVDAASGRGEAAAVDADRQCRSCVLSRHSSSQALLANECVSTETVGDACSCDDDEAAFEFVNGAVAHYHFAHKEEGKRFEDALEAHGTSFSDYDVVFANAGNKPHMEVPETLRAAGQLREEGVALFWTSTYEGGGDVGAWLPTEQREFWQSGARFLPVHRMVESLTYLTKGVVEGEDFNPHFCLPGPPTEIGLLLLRIAWALHAESRGEGRRSVDIDGGVDRGRDGDGDGDGHGDNQDDVGISADGDGNGHDEDGGARRLRR